jgi:hypothetical protein
MVYFIVLSPKHSLDYIDIKRTDSTMGWVLRVIMKAATTEEMVT